MFDKLSWLVVDRAYAQNVNTTFGDRLFGLFNGANIFGSPNNTAITANSSAPKIIGLITGWLLVIAGVIAFIYLILHGIAYITAGGDAEKATKARTGILNAIIGIAVIVIAFLIIRFAIGIGSTINTTIGQ